MTSLASTPLEQRLFAWWTGIDRPSRTAFLVLLCVNVLAFGFEMTNLTLHHDDVNHILIQDTILGHYLGRFGHGWLHYYTQNHYVMPFLQMLEGIVMMSAYGVVVARFWGVRNATDIALVGAILCVFPYMAHVYQYNTAMAAYPAAHLLAAVAVVLSARATLPWLLVAALLYVGAFSIYQGVASVAATVFVIWLLVRTVFGGADESLLARGTVRSTAGVLIAVIAGGAVYLAAVLSMNIPPDTIHASEEAFHLRGAMTPTAAIPDILRGTRGFFLWPEPYFPGYLKDLQLVLLAAALAFCVWLPKGVSAKAIAVALLLAACFTPRALQLLHPKGNYHTLTLTAYALLVAASAMIVLRCGRKLARNAGLVVATLLVAGYVTQCNWISTVGYLNTLAHTSTFTQILAQLRSVPDAQWDGTTIAVAGRYQMPNVYPLIPATGVATSFLDAPRMNMLARVMRERASFVAADESTPKVREFASTRPAWPRPGSVGVVDGIGVVVLSKPPAR
jgi:hypothetical protein